MPVGHLLRPTSAKTPCIMLAHHSLDSEPARVIAYRVAPTLNDVAADSDCNAAPMIPLPLSSAYDRAGVLAMVAELVDERSAARARMRMLTKKLSSTSLCADPLRPRVPCPILSDVEGDGPLKKPGATSSSVAPAALESLAPTGPGGPWRHAGNQLPTDQPASRPRPAGHSGRLAAQGQPGDKHLSLVGSGYQNSNPQIETAT